MRLPEFFTTKSGRAEMADNSETTLAFDVINNAFPIEVKSLGDTGVGDPTMSSKRAWHIRHVPVSTGISCLWNAVFAAISVTYEEKMNRSVNMRHGKYQQKYNNRNSYNIIHVNINKYKKQN
jgi:hypothetical protein